MMVVHVKKFRQRCIAIGAGAAAMAAIVFLLVGCLGRGQTAEPQPVPAADNEQRSAYLTGLGWEIDPEPLETLILQLPANLTDAYADYTALQNEQGLPFAQFGGRTATRYTYTVRNFPDYGGSVQANLYVCDGQLIGGDVIASGENGFVRGLAFPE